MSAEDGRPTLVDLHAMVMEADADVEDLASALEDSVSWSVVDPTDATLREAMPTADTRIAVALRRRPTGTARWKPFLRGLGVPLDTSASSENESVLVVVRTATEPEQTIIWCFGTASLAVPQDLVDSRFGLIAALNKHTAGAAIPSWRMLPSGVRGRGRPADPHARVRRLTSTVRDGYRHSVVARSVAAAPVGGLRFDSVSDLLRGVVVRTEDELMPDLEGGRGLKLATYVDGWDDLARLADHLVGLHRRTDYRQEWDWVDHVLPVTPRAEAVRVMTELGRLVVDDPEIPLDIVLPDWEDEGPPAAELMFRMGHETAWSRPVEWYHLRRHLLRVAPGPTAALHRRVRIGPGPTPSRDAPVQEISVKDLLTGEFHLGEDHYVIGDGELLQVRSDFLESLDAAVADAQEVSVREIARRIGRDPGTVSRELRRNAATRGGKLEHRASVAQWKAELMARRPKTAKLVANKRLHDYVERRLCGQVRHGDGTVVSGPDTTTWKGRNKPHRQDRRWAQAWSPEQISNRLRVDFPDDESMRISHEAIYQALFVQARGALKREVVACLRT